MSAVAARLSDGRLHLQHGPIDLIIEAFGAADEVERAYGQAVDRFGDILPTLVRELPILRRPVNDAYPLLQGPVARRMAEAVWPHRSVYITPMAAVAGAVADEMVQALVKDRRLDKAYVNDGGDIAIHLTPGHELRAGIFAAALDGVARLTYDRPVRGIATSGRSPPRCPRRCAMSSNASPRIASRRCAPCYSWRVPAARCAPASRKIPCGSRAPSATR